MDGLPRQFLSSLRILFDILDENRTGFVRLCDIESRWSDDGVRGLPPGVVDGLRKVTPPNGFLSFDRFVAGLKLVLATKRKESNEFNIEGRKPFVSKENRLHSFDNQRERGPVKQDDNKNNRINSEVRLTSNNKPTSNARDQRSIQNHQGPNNSVNTVGSRPAERRYNESSNRQTNEGNRKSPQFPSAPSSGGPVKARENTFNAFAIKPDVSSYPNTVGSHLGPSSGNSFRRSGNSNSGAAHQEKPPAVPPRSDRLKSQGQGNVNSIKKSLSGPDLYSRSPPAVPPRERQSNTRILNDLKNWQKEWTESRKPGQDSHEYNIYRPDKNSEDTIYANIQQFQNKSEEQRSTAPPAQSGPLKATVRRHGSGRRHTLADGIDQNMLKRMKQLEEETSILRAGLAMVDSARDWYKKQLSAVSDKQAMLGKVSYNDNSVEAYQERMNFQRARIAEVNQHLRLLVESSEKGFPLHMNLAVSTGRPPNADSGLRALTEHNRRLMEELSQNRDQMAQLEQEKASLVRELFESRAKHQMPNYDDTTFM
ncbi:uncharacterized protein LOC101855452 [Aplysia californica]|uniref:Uncharacterized protein LOC101855452 n=1 Tax=Aplysia californica TaxID=6500 RepID=A0ABM0J9Z8_APLCA|nr:uncharacterized protein LOC101855452 [Aplysia californica]